MSEGLTLMRIMDGIIRASVRDQGYEPSNFLIGEQDVPWLRHEGGFDTDPATPMLYEYQGIPIGKMRGVRGVIGVDGATWLHLVAAGLVNSI